MLRTPDFYVALRHVHVALVSISVAVFALRGLGVLAGGTWPGRTRLRVAVVLVDIALLTAGVLLWVMAGLNPGRDTWLGVKLGLLVVYVVLGTWALKRARTLASRAVFYVAALACATTMVLVARTHRPPWAW